MNPVRSSIIAEMAEATHQARCSAIAEAVGRSWHQPTLAEFASGSYYQYAPDYFQDLAAIDDAVLSYFNPKVPAHQFRYFDALAGVTDTPSGMVSMALIHATAAQRAEAFLRTIGKWEVA